MAVEAARRPLGSLMPSLADWSIWCQEMAWNFLHTCSLQSYPATVSPCAPAMAGFAHRDGHLVLIRVGFELLLSMYWHCESSCTRQHAGCVVGWGGAGARSRRSTEHMAYIHIPADLPKDQLSAPGSSEMRSWRACTQVQVGRLVVGGELA